MRKILLSFFVFLTMKLTAQFSAGNIVVLRSGDGSGSLSSASTAAFLVEFNQNGDSIRQYPIPTTASGNRLVIGGSSTTEGMLSRSRNGLFLVFGGYDTATAVTSVATTTTTAVSRVIGYVNSAGTFDLTTRVPIFSGNSIRSVVSSDGTDFWAAGGSTGTAYGLKGGSTATTIQTTITNQRVLSIYNGQLYMTTASGTNARVQAIGTGLPTTSGTTLTGLNGVPTTGGGPNQFFMADVNPAIPGLDVLYVADDLAGLTKYYLEDSGGGVYTWKTNGTLGTSADLYRGVTGIVSGTNVTLFATSKASGTGNSSLLVKIQDNTSYNTSATSFTTGASNLTVNTIYTSGLVTNMAFRGVALAPVSAPLPANLVSFNAGVLQGKNKIWWSTDNESATRSYEIERSFNGTDYATIVRTNATKKNGLNSYETEDVNPSENVNYYRLKIINNDGSFKYSNVLVVRASSKIKLSIYPNPAKDFLTISYPKATDNSFASIINMNGKVIKNIALQKGATQSQLNISNLNPGNYIIRVVINDEFNTIKFVK